MFFSVVVFVVVVYILIQYWKEEVCFQLNSEKKIAQAVPPATSCDGN
jgi:hypothetical protein|tara:strand:- start:866 stop:1006 length:141 start_codon:yes stop_codon:yes gene_type:complete